jgi:opacity protein-like surface antigen
VTGGYENSDYTANRLGVIALRNDDYFFTRLGMDWALADRLTVGAYYQFRKNDSTDASHSFDNHQVGINAVYHF